MTREEREALSQRFGNFYYDSAKKSVKTTVNYFKKQKCSTKYDILCIKKVFTIWNHQGSVTKWSSTQIIQEELE